MKPVARRELLKSGLLAVSSLAAPLVLPSAARGSIKPSERLTIAVIGNGAMGSGHVHRLAGDPAFQMLAVCDVDSSRRERAKAHVDAAYVQQQSSGAYSGCVAYNDFRELLARRDLDAVVIATPDHWHALQSIEAARAGKDVYCEKPISVTIQEGQEVIRTMRRFGRVFQTGTQYRSIPSIRRVCQFVRQGGLGNIKSAFTIIGPLWGWLRSGRFAKYLKPGDADRYGKSYAPVDIPLPAEPVPAGLDWDLWVGPARWLPYNSLYHTNPSPGVVPWSFCDAFGVTANTWYLSHAADVIQWAIREETGGPVEIIHPSSGQFPTLTFRYASGTLLHFVEGWDQVKSRYGAVPKNARLEGNFGGVFVGERGWVTSMTTGGLLEGEPAAIFREMGVPTREAHIGSNNHHANFLECARSRSKPSAHEEIGHRSASMGHLAFIAYRLGRSLKWDPAAEQFAGDEMANRMRSRAVREPWGM